MSQLLAIGLFLFSSMLLIGQSIDEPFSRNKMERDLEIFKEIRQSANSGLYKYRTKAQIDSVYQWAENEIQRSSTYRDFYNVICQLTDFEGSLHNDTSMPDKKFETVKNEQNGYFPFPLKWIEDKWLMNFAGMEISLGSEITSINGEKIESVIPQLYKYYTTDGVNTTGKRIGIARSFPLYYRYQNGLQHTFTVGFKSKSSEEESFVELESVSYAKFRENFDERHSLVFDRLQFTGKEKDERYLYRQIDDKTDLLTINTFSIGGHAEDEEHKTYVQWLDSVFVSIKKSKTENLIVDVRNNGGGTDPNDVITYSYLTDREFQESKEVWISFNKIPLLKYFDSSVPRILRPLGIAKYNKYFQKRFPNEQDGKFFIAEESNEMKVRLPNEHAFMGNIYLLICPRVASAASLFAALLAGNDNTTTIGEEAMGGYYGHNGHTSFGYVLPKSKIVVDFSIDNIEQDVPKRANQIYNRGIIPDSRVLQSYDDFLDNVDTQMNFVMELIESQSK